MSPNKWHHTVPIPRLDIQRPAEDEYCISSNQLYSVPIMELRSKRNFTSEKFKNHLSQKQNNRKYKKKNLNPFMYKGKKALGTYLKTPLTLRQVPSLTSPYHQHRRSKPCVPSTIDESKQPLRRCHWLLIPLIPAICNMLDPSLQNLFFKVLPRCCCLHWEFLLYKPDWGKQH